MSTKTLSAAKTRAPKTKKSDVLADALTIVKEAMAQEEQTQVAPVTPGDKVQPLKTSTGAYVSSDGKFTYLTDHLLRRSILTEADAKMGRIFIPHKEFRELTRVGAENGVTWDEMLRAVLVHAGHFPEIFKSAVKFLPPDLNVD